MTPDESKRIPDPTAATLEDIADELVGQGEYAKAAIVRSAGRRVQRLETEQELADVLLRGAPVVVTTGVRWPGNRGKSFDEFLTEIRAVGGDSWDDVADVNAELGR